MKNTKKPVKAKTAECKVDTAHCSAPAQYAMRAECQADCVQMRAVLGTWVSMWREDQCTSQGTNGKTYRIPDVDIAFSMNADAPGLEEIRWLLDQLVDCHVGAQSVSHATEYTGERAFDKLEQLMRRPSNEVIGQALECAKRTKVGLRANFGRIDEAIEKLEAEIACDHEQLEKRAREIALLLAKGGGLAFKRNKQYALNVARNLAQREYFQSRRQSSK